eukprot:2662185-Heterocapsa_arctica.AAC.1
MTDFGTKRYSLNDDRSDQHQLVHSRQEGDTQVLYLGQNQPSGLFQEFHCEKHIRDKERCGERRRNKINKKAGRRRKVGHTLYRIGEASNPGPSQTSHSKQ